MIASAALFQIDFGSQDLNICPIPTNNSSTPNKRANSCDLLPPEIYVVSGNYVSTLTYHVDFPQVILLTSYVFITYHAIIRDKPIHATDKTRQ